MLLRYYDDNGGVAEYEPSVEETLDAVAEMVADDMLDSKHLDSKAKEIIKPYIKATAKRILLDCDIDWEDQYHDWLEDYFKDKAWKK